jgi:hypothetical protein
MATVEPGAAALFQYPFVFACGHGNIKFTPAEVTNMARYLTSGGFLWVDDDYGIDVSIRREMKRVFPDAAFVELPFTHPLFAEPYSFPHGLPKIHEHDGGPAKAFGILRDGAYRTLCYDTDLVCRGRSQYDPRNRAALHGPQHHPLCADARRSAPGLNENRMHRATESGLGHPPQSSPPSLPRC